MMYEHESLVEVSIEKKHFSGFNQKKISWRRKERRSKSQFTPQLEARDLSLSRRVFNGSVDELVQEVVQLWYIAQEQFSVNCLLQLMHSPHIDYLVNFAVQQSLCFLRDDLSDVAPVKLACRC